MFSCNFGYVTLSGGSLQKLVVGCCFWILKLLYGAPDRHCRFLSPAYTSASDRLAAPNCSFRCSLAAPGPHDARLSAGFVPRGSDGHQIELQKRYAADLEGRPAEDEKR